MFAVVSILIICGNILTILVMTRAKPLQSNIRFLIINLAVADLTVGLLTIPLFLYRVVASNYGVQLVYRMLDVFTGYASIFSLVAVAAERFIAISWPLKYENTKQKTYGLVIVIVWLIATCLGVLMGLRTLKKIAAIAFYMPMMVCFFSSLGILILCYSAIWFVVRRSRTEELKSFEKQLSVTVLVVTLLFVVMWMPFHVLNILHYYKVPCGGHCNFHFIAFFKLLHYGNSLLNPLIYGFRIPGFTKAARKLFRRDSPASDHEANGGGITMESIAGNNI